MTIGVLALQGAFDRHLVALDRLGARVRAVRLPADLKGIDGLVLPGGESTTMSKLLVAQGLFDPLSDLLADELPVMGTCAGMILLASTVIDGRPDQLSFGAIDLTVQRNGYGRQINSFETDLDVAGIDGHDLHAVFIRAPRVISVGASVDVLATFRDDPVVCRSGSVLVASFHPELTHDLRLHELFLSLRGV